MTDDQKVAILEVLMLLNNVDIPAALIKMYGAADTQLFISLPGVETEEPENVGSK